MIADEYLGPDEDDLHDDERVYPEYFEVHKKNPDMDTQTWTREGLKAVCTAANFEHVLIERIVEAYESAREANDRHSDST